MGGAGSGTPYADFGTGFDQINGLNTQGTSSTYTVQSGDTLQGISIVRGQS